MKNNTTKSAGERVYTLLKLGGCSCLVAAGLILLEGPIIPALGLLPIVLAMVLVFVL